MSGESSKPKRSIGSRIFRVLAGFELALICLGFVFLATLFGTFEQTQVGLYRTLEKYFDKEALYILPTFNGKNLPLPMPGTFWVCTVLFVNLTLGGLGRARKGWKTAGVLISHFGMLMLLVAGGVSEYQKKEGVMSVYQGDRSDYARSYTEPSIEVYTYDAEGEPEKPTVVKSEHFTELDDDETLTVRLPDLPFDLKVTGFLRASQLLNIDRNEDQHEGEQVLDGFFLKERIRDNQEERNHIGCYLTVMDKDGSSLQEVILHHLGHVQFPSVVTASVDGKRYGFSLTRELWPMPFEVELHKSLGDYYPGTRAPKWFQSDITKIDDDLRTEYSIVMNKPMRHGGITLYQANWSPPMRGGRPHSGFAIVENPSDQWPKWALFVATFGLLVHFGYMLTRFLQSSPKRKQTPVDDNPKQTHGDAD